MGQLEGKVALVTGAARGMGAAVARLFVAEGARVVIADMLEEQGRMLATELADAALFLPLDVTRPESWADAVTATEAHFGRLDVLVNNAGILRIGSLEDFSFEDYQAVINVNQTGCWLGMKTVLGPMKRAGGGAIVNISSTGGLTGLGGFSAYVASKFAVRGMTKSAALEYGRHNIRVNSVHPGGMATAMDVSEDGSAYARQPIPRVGQPAEVAELVVFLASERASYCTGAEYVADGGLLAGKDFS